MTESDRPEVVVIGAGIAGLSAAYELTGSSSPHATGPLVTIIEAALRTGGKIAATLIADHEVDAAADGVLARRPEVLSLIDDLGISHRIEPIAASGASVFARGKLRLLPSDLQMGIPTSFSSLRASGTLSTRGLIRAFRDVVAPRPASRGHLQDRTIGGLIETKLGPEVVSTLVDPMIGGISAGRVSEMSAAAVFPPLLEAAQERGSLMAALRSVTAPPRSSTAQPGDAEGPADIPPPSFVSLTGGMHELPATMEQVLRDRGVRFITGTEITGLRRGGGTDPCWLVDSASTTTARARPPADARAASEDACTLST